MNNQLIIRRAIPAEASQLTDLNFRSKAHWGYDTEFMELVRGEMIVTVTDITDEHVYLAEDVTACVLGFYELKIVDNHLHLESLFIEPEAIGSGCGRALFAHAVQLARQLGFAQFTLDADPNAEPFYIKMGAQRVGMLESRLKGRYLPQMVYEIPPIAKNELPNA